MYRELLVSLKLWCPVGTGHHSFNEMLLKCGNNFVGDRSVSGVYVTIPNFSLLLKDKMLFSLPYPALGFLYIWLRSACLSTVFTLVNCVPLSFSKLRCMKYESSIKMADAKYNQTHVLNSSDLGLYIERSGCSLKVCIKCRAAYTG